MNDGHEEYLVKKDRLEDIFDINKRDVKPPKFVHFCMRVTINKIDKFTHFYFLSENGKGLYIEQANKHFKKYKSIIFETDSKGRIEKDDYSLSSSNKTNSDSRLKSCISNEKMVIGENRIGAEESIKSYTNIIKETIAYDDGDKLFSSALCVEIEESSSVAIAGYYISEVKKEMINYNCFLELVRYLVSEIKKEKEKIYRLTRLEESYANTYKVLRDDFEGFDEELNKMVSFRDKAKLVLFGCVHRLWSVQVHKASGLYDCFDTNSPGGQVAFHKWSDMAKILHQGKVDFLKDAMSKLTGINHLVENVEDRVYEFLDYLIRESSSECKLKHNKQLRLRIVFTMIKSYFYDIAIAKDSNINMGCFLVPAIYSTSDMEDLEEVKCILGRKESVFNFIGALEHETQERYVIQSECFKVEACDLIKTLSYLCYLIKELCGEEGFLILEKVIINKAMVSYEFKQHKGFKIEELNKLFILGNADVKKGKLHAEKERLFDNNNLLTKFSVSKLKGKVFLTVNLGGVDGNHSL